MHFLHGLNFGHIPYAQLSVVAWLLIVLALLFDFLNGFHDAANSVATVVSTRVLAPRAAVIWAALFNFVAFLVFPFKVQETIQKIIDASVLNVDGNLVLTAILTAACAWNVLTWYLALPTSSSHALIGAMIGAALAKTLDWHSLHFEPILMTVLFIFLSPILGGILGLLTAWLVTWVFRSAPPRRVDAVFRKGQLLSAAWFSLNHGGNDAQKTMGIIVLLIAANSGQSFAEHLERAPYTEVVLACFGAIGLGTFFGGWRIVKTMGQRIIKLRPVDGFCAENGAGLAVALATTVFGGVPVSTTHTIAGAIIGVGSLKRVSAVRWGVAGRVVWAWILTIPGAGLMAALIWWILKLL
jgi:inorganic phosphate transporter, PiT family